MIVKFCAKKKFQSLQPLRNFRIPRHEDETDYYGSSSQDETRGNQGTKTLLGFMFGTLSDFFFISVS